MNKQDRPSFHLTPQIGWMNDPNGFSWYQGKYHMFYQYNPKATNWGPPCWGHAVSDDLISWERLPVALETDHDYESFGCFSGTAIDTGRHMIMYTGCKLDPADDKGRGLQTQCMAFGDGLKYCKHEGNPVITAELLPEGGDPHEFRDPKLWQEADGTFRALIANHNAQRGAQLLLFGSPDGTNWSFRKVLMENHGLPGWMWECPDFFPLGQKQVLLTSAMCDNVNLCMIGEYDRQTETFQQTAWQTLDQGFDFYAGQTAAAPDGRRILIGWMQNPATAENREVDLAINGQLSLPRELHLQGDQVLQRPVKELADYRADEVVYKNVKLGSDKPQDPAEIRLDQVQGRRVDMEIAIKPDGSSMYEMFRMRFAGNGQQFTEFTYEPKTNKVSLDRSQSGPGRTNLTKKEADVRDRKGRLDIRVILDILSAEIFINDGEQVMSAVIYTDRHAEDITFYAKGAAIMDIAKYRIEENK